MDEERKGCIARRAIVDDRLAVINEEWDSLNNALENSWETDPRQFREMHRRMNLLDAERTRLNRESARLEILLERNNKWKITMKQWIHQTLPDINYFENQSSGGPSYRYEGYWPQDLKTWEDFGANVRAHVKELEIDDTQYSRNADDFQGLLQYVDCTHSNIRQRFTEILKDFMRYQPFKECVVQLSVLKSGASTQPSTEASAESTEANAALGPIQKARSASAESTEANAALGPIQMARSASADSTEDRAAIRRANEMAKPGRTAPDISVQNGENFFFLVIECKRPTMIRRDLERKFPDLSCPATEVLKETIQQVTKYMVRKKVGHAILTSEDLTYFFKIEGQSMFVSDGLVWNSPDIPWLGAIHYILNTAKDIINVNFSNYGTSGGPQKARGKRRKKSPLGTGSPTTQQQDACDVSANCHLHEVSRSLKEVNVVDLNLAKSDYARGSTGAVALGQTCGQQVIIKIAPINDRRGHRLLHEVKVYHSLLHLWGQSIPQLVDYGSTVNGSLVYLATEYIAGVHLNRAPISEEVASAARKALGAIHCSGVLHGDLHAGNILVVDKDVRIIDFGFARYSHDRSNQERELNELEKILQEQMTDE